MEHHRPALPRRTDPRWLLLSPLSTVVGGVVGATGVAAAVVADFARTGVPNGDPGGIFTGLLGIAVFGAVCGAAVGLAGGLVVGLVLTVVVGRDMPDRAAAAMSFVGATATVALLLWLVLDRWFDPVSDHHLVPAVSAGAVAAGAVATWFRHQLPDAPRAAEVGPHPRRA